MELSDPERARGARWVIVVGHDHAEMFEHLCRAFLGDAKVQVVLERRADESRNPGWVKEQLRKDGVVIIRVPEDLSRRSNEDPERASESRRSPNPPE